MQVKVRLGLVLLLLSAGCMNTRTRSQNGELFTRGTLTDAEGQVWNIRFIPGVFRVTEDAADHWREAGSNLADFGRADFMRDHVADPFRDGLKFSRQVVTEHWISGIGRDFREARKRVSETQWSRSLHALYQFGVKVPLLAVARTVWVPIGVTGGAVYSVTYPTAAVASRPVSAAVHSAGLGITLPALRYLWTGTGWLVSYPSGLPTEADGYWVTQVPPPLRLEELELLARACSDRFDYYRAIAPRQAEIERLSLALQEASEELAVKQEELAQREPEKQLQFRKSAQTPVELTPEVEAHLVSRDTLRRWVASWLRDQSASPNPERVNRITELLWDTLRGADRSEL